MLHVKELTWDDWNIAHIGRHHVKPGEVVAVCRRRHLVRTTYAGRLILIGTSNANRAIVVVLGPNGDDTYYPITARPASRKERRALGEELDADAT